MPSKIPRKSKKQLSNDTKISLWVDTFIGAGARKTGYRAEVLADACSDSIGFHVSTARMVRVLQRKGVIFNGSAEYTKGHPSRLDLLINRVTALEKAVDKLKRSRKKD